MNPRIWLLEDHLMMREQNPIVVKYWDSWDAKVSKCASQWNLALVKEDFFQLISMPGP